ncbi:MAG: hypothetical protein ACI8Z7_000456 [Candidatus Nanohaloarchaea archaeon]|jgi:hypothetical protein
MSSDLFKSTGHSLGSLEQDLSEVYDYNIDLRVNYEEEPEIILLDDCVVMDYLKKRGRRSESRQFGDSYFEGPQDIEKLLRDNTGEILIPERFNSPTSRFGSISDEKEEERLELLKEETDFIDIEGIKPREGFRESEHADHRDIRIAEFGYSNDSVIVTYDDDFLKFPVNYTTPGMLL